MMACGMALTQNGSASLLGNDLLVFILCLGLTRVPGCGYGVGMEAAGVPEGTQHRDPEGSRTTEGWAE